ncbi:MAG: von Willebrand factor type A domain-containing protein [Bacteroidales bacterium]|nr:von Willebrand factor type A domain-containing protein [Bacteroidales bacterium]
MKKNIIPAIAVLALLTSCSSMDYFDGKYAYDNNAYYDMASEAGYLPEPENPEGGDRFDKIVENDFIDTETEPTSTFSVDADGAAYAYMRRCINEGWLPSANAVRIEEYLNYFTFNYSDPQDGKGVGLNAEAGPCPWNPEHKLLRLGIKGKSLEHDPLANFVFLIDISGSMSSSDKLPLLKQGLITMLDYMKPQDRVAIVTYASGEKLELESTPVSEKSKIVKVIKSLAASGSTNGASAMKMAYEQALKNYIEGGNNRVIMGTDGDFNVGITGTDAICEFVQNYASKGVYITICGFGSGNLNDSMMEKVSNSGNGTYEYIDSENELTKVFVNERSRFVTVANDCKTQVTFNKDVVKQYRLIGYENRVLQNDDFENDKVDAAEIGAGQTITALYELVMASNEGSVGKFDFRYKDAIGGESIPVSMELPSVTDNTSENLQFAGALAAWGLWLRESKYKGSASVEMVLDLAKNSLGEDPYGLRKEFVELVQKAQDIKN